MKTGRKSADNAGNPFQKAMRVKIKENASEQRTTERRTSKAGKTGIPAIQEVTERTESPASNLVQQSRIGRAFWSGTISIGLISIPVRLHTMVHDQSFPFRLLHRKDGQPLRYDRVCSRDGLVVPWTETIKGYEVRTGEFVTFEPAELKAVMPESDRRIRIEKFVYYLSLDPMYFENSYILTPDRSEEAYSLLHAILAEESRAAAGTVTLRTKEYPVVIHAYRGGLVLTTLRYADEVTLPHEFEILKNLPAPKSTELVLAKRIINELAGDFAITDYHDRYREAVLALIERKLTGKKIVHEEARPEEVKELMQALKETLAALPKP